MCGNRGHTERKKGRVSGECLGSVALVLGDPGTVQKAQRRQEAHDTQTILAGTCNRVACEPQVLQTRESGQVSNLPKVGNLCMLRIDVGVRVLQKKEVRKKGEGKTNTVVGKLKGLERGERRCNVVGSNGGDAVAAEEQCGEAREAREVGQRGDVVAREVDAIKGVARRAKVLDLGDALAAQVQLALVQRVGVECTLQNQLARQFHHLRKHTLQNKNDDRPRRR